MKTMFEGNSCVIHKQTTRSGMLVRSDERVSFGVLQTRAAQINQVLVGYQHKTKHILTKGV